ncbi:MAG: hypothetical protein RL022_2403, partial [Chloroflexota bacterium]
RPDNRVWLSDPKDHGAADIAVPAKRRSALASRHGSGECVRSRDLLDRRSLSEGQARPVIHLTHRISFRVSASQCPDTRRVTQAGGDHDGDGVNGYALTP